MNYKTALFSLITFLVIFPSCNTWKVSQLQKKGLVDSRSFLQELDFEFRKGLIVVKAWVNGSEEPFEFIFDTGAYTTTISRELADQLDLKPKANRQVGDSRGNVRKIGVVQLDEVMLAGLPFKKIAAGVVDFPENSAIQCIAKDGIIGANLIRECHWKFDFQQQKIWLTDDFSNFPETKGQQAFPFQHSRKNGKPYVDIRMEEYAIKDILIDMGSNGGVDIPRKWLKKRPDFLEGKSIAINYDSTSTGLWGRGMDTTKVVLIDSLQLGPHQIPEWRVDFNQRGNPKIGMEMLAHFDLFLNYETSKMYLLPNQELEPYDLQVFGFVPDYVSPDYFIIRNLFEPSPASAAGLMLGDTISHINGKKPVEHFDGFCDYFEWAGKLLRNTDTLTVTKNGAEIQLVRASLFPESDE